MSTLTPELLPTLSAGTNAPGDGLFNILELVSVWAGEPFTSKPVSVHPVLAAMAEQVSGLILPDPQGIAHLIPALHGTADTREDETERQVLSVLLAAWAAQEVVYLAADPNAAQAAIDAARAWADCPCRDHGLEARLAEKIARAVGRPGGGGAVAQTRAKVAAEAAQYAADAAATSHSADAATEAAALAVESATQAARLAPDNGRETLAPLLEGLITEHARLTGRGPLPVLTEADAARLRGITGPAPRFIALLEGLLPTLSDGTHDPGDGVFNVLELLSVWAGESFTSYPMSVHPVIAAMAVTVNDLMPANLRYKIAYLIPALHGTADARDDETARQVLSVRLAAWAAQQGVHRVLDRESAQAAIDAARAWADCPCEEHAQAARHAEAVVRAGEPAARSARVYAVEALLAPAYAAAAATVSGGGYPVHSGAARSAVALAAADVRLDPHRGVSALPALLEGLLTEHARLTGRGPLPVLTEADAARLRDIARPLHKVTLRLPDPGAVAQALRNGAALADGLPEGRVFAILAAQIEDQLPLFAAPTTKGPDE